MNSAALHCSTFAGEEEAVTATVGRSEAPGSWRQCVQWLQRSQRLEAVSGVLCRRRWTSIEEVGGGGGAGGSGGARAGLDHIPGGPTKLEGRSGGRSWSGALYRCRRRSSAIYRGGAGAGSLDDDREGLEQVFGAPVKLGGGSGGTVEVRSARRAAVVDEARRGRKL